MYAHLSNHYYVYMIDASERLPWNRAYVKRWDSISEQEMKHSHIIHIRTIRESVSDVLKCDRTLVSRRFHQIVSFISKLTCRIFNWFRCRPNVNGLKAVFFLYVDHAPSTYFIVLAIDNMQEKCYLWWIIVFSLTHLMLLGMCSK